MTIRILTALTLLITLPGAAAAEGRPGDHFDVTAGHTALLTLADDAAGAAGPVELWLHADHGTLRQTVRGAPPGHPVGLNAGVGEADPRPAGFFDGRPPALWTSAVLLEPPRARAAGDDLRLWTWRPATGRYTVAWTVPYAGDTWGMSGHRDCDCGSPVGVGIAHTGLTVQTGGPGPDARSVGVPLTAYNRSGAVVDVFEGQTPVARLSAGQRWTTRTRGQVLTFSFIEGWQPPASWAPPTPRAERALIRAGVVERAHRRDDVRLQNACEIVGTGHGDEGPAPTPGGPLTVRCSTTREAQGKRTMRDRRVSPLRAAEGWDPAALAAGDPGPGYNPHELMRTAFVADMLREHVAPPPPRALADWPLLAGGGLEHLGERWVPLDGAGLTVSASSTLASKTGRYAAGNLLDGDPTSAWCEGAAGHGVGERIAVSVPGPPRPVLVALVPGHARGDWHYAANGAPVSVRAADGAVLTPLRLPDSADLYREGQALEVVGVMDSDAVALSLHGLRPGLRFADTCISEVVLFERR